MTVFEILAVCSPAISIIISLLAFRREQKSDDGIAAREMGAISTKIDDVRNQIAELGRKIERLEQTNTGLMERITAVEESVRSAHRRIDNLEKG